MYLLTNVLVYRVCDRHVLGGGFEELSCLLPGSVSNVIYLLYLAGQRRAYSALARLLCIDGAWCETFGKIKVENSDLWGGHTLACSSVNSYPTSTILLSRPNSN